MKKLLFLMTIFFYINISANVLNNIPLLDFSENDFTVNAEIPLQGTWLFIPGEFKSTDGVNINNESKNLFKTNLPGLWDTNSSEIKEILREKPFGTYYIRVKLPQKNIFYSIHIPYMYTAYKLYIDNIITAENGIPSKIEQNEKPMFKTENKVFFAKKDEVLICIHISSFNDRKGGIWEVPSIAKNDHFFITNNFSLFYDFSIFGALILFGLYHLGLHLFRKDEWTSFFFGLFCIAIGFRTLFVGDVFIYTLFPNFSWFIACKIEYILIFSMPIFYILYSHFMFMEVSKKFFVKFYCLSGAIFIFLIIILPREIYSYFLYLFLLYFIIGIFFITLLYYKAYKEKLPGTFNAILGFGIFFLTIVNDLLFGLELIKTINLIQYGFLFFILTHSLNIAFIFAKAYDNVISLTQSLKEINTLFKRFVPFQFISFLNIKNPTDIKLGDNTESIMHVFFSDIRSFTELSEKMTPEENFKFINSYFSKISPIIRINNGFIDKFIGDSVMALFYETPDMVIDTAIQFQKQQLQYNSYRANSGYDPIKTGIGINTGSVMLGIIGESERFESTLISDTVNTASRLENLTKTFDTDIILSGKTLIEINDPTKYDFRILGKIKVKGKKECVVIYELFWDKNNPKQKIKLENKHKFEIALSSFQRGEISKSQNLFEDLLKINPSDTAAEIYYNKSIEILKNGIPDNWEGNLDTEKI